MQIEFLRKKHVKNKVALYVVVAFLFACVCIWGSYTAVFSNTSSSASCSDFNGNSSACNDAQGCSYPGNLGSCSDFNGDSTACNAQGCYYFGSYNSCSDFNGDYGTCVSTSGCSYPGNIGSCSDFDGNPSACGLTYGCTGANSGNSNDIFNCYGNYDNGACTGSYLYEYCGGSGYDNGACVGDYYPAPTITSVSSDKADGTYTVGEVIDIDFTFSEAVTSNGNVTAILETGDTDRTCVFTVSNSTTGTCDYIVQENDATADLTVSSISGTITGQFSNAMSNFTPTTNLADNKDIVIETIEAFIPNPDTTAPTLSSGSPDGEQVAGTTEVNLEVQTDENATCKYGTVANTAYASIESTFGTTGGTTHTQTLTGLTDGTSYAYYVRCSDALLNVTTSDTTIAFSVAIAVNDGSGGGRSDSFDWSQTYRRTYGESISDETDSNTPTADTATTDTSATLNELLTSLKALIADETPDTSRLTDLINELKSLFAGLLVSNETSFNVNLGLGTEHPDVLRLQQFLNARGFTIATTGPGSAGNETSYFGPATENALIRFQITYNITPAFGFFGPVTRAFVEGL